MQELPRSAADERKLTTAIPVGAIVNDEPTAMACATSVATPPIVAIHQHGRPQGGERTPNGHPVEENRRGRHDERPERHPRRDAAERRRIRPERQPDDEQRDRQPGVEAEELDAGVASHQRQRADDADAQVRQKQKQDGGERHESGTGLTAGRTGSARRAGVANSP